MIINLKLFIKLKLVNVTNLNLDQVAHLLVCWSVIVSQEMPEVLVSCVLAVLRVQACVATKQHRILVRFNRLRIIGMHIKQLLELLYYML